MVLKRKKRSKIKTHSKKAKGKILKAKKKQKVKKISTQKFKKSSFASIEQTLLKMKKDLLSGIAINIKDGSENTEAEIGDILDVTTKEREREFMLSMGNREREKLLEIDDALNKIKDGSYGICEECSKQIPTGRLKVMPFTKLCVECKSKTERENEINKTLEEEHTYPDVAVTEFEEDEV